MRSAVAAVAFAAGALAVPFKRDVVTDVDVVYTTDVVTVFATADSPAPATAAAEPTTTSAPTFSQANHYGNHGGWSGHWTWQQSEAAPVSSEATTSVWVAPTTTTTEAAPVPTTTSTEAAPVPTTTSTEAAPPPATTTTSTAPAWTPATTAAATSSVWSAVTSAASPSGTGYSDVAVAQHNAHRSNHSAPALEWDDGLASIAATIASSCVYAHNVDVGGGGYGQNIAAGVEGKDIATIITNLFYNGEVNWFNGLYGQANPDMTNFEKWGHFSQIVWKSTTAVGCATQYCPSGLGNVGSDVSPYFTVCNYKSPGNYGGEYADNIGQPLGNPTIDGDSIIAST